MKPAKRQMTSRSELRQTGFELDSAEFAAFMAQRSPLSLNNIGGPVLAQDFRRFRVLQGRPERFWNGRTHGVCSDQFQWCGGWVHHAEPLAPCVRTVVQRFTITGRARWWWPMYRTQEHPNSGQRRRQEFQPKGRRTGRKSQDMRRR